MSSAQAAHSVGQQDRLLTLSAFSLDVHIAQVGGAPSAAC